MLVPANIGDHIADLANTIRIILGQIFNQAGNRRMHFTASKLALIGNLAGRRLHQSRAAQRGHAIMLHADIIIRHAGHISAACR